MDADAEVELTNVDRSGESLLADPTSSVLESKGFIGRHKKIFIGVSVVIAIVMISLFDVWYNLIHKSHITMDSAEVDLESSPNSDVTMTIHGSMGSRSYISSMTVDDSKCAVKYASSGAATATWQDLGILHSAVQSTANDKYDLTLTLQDVSYSPLRHLISDAYWATPLGASVECNAGVTLYLYNILPVRLYANIEASMRTPTPGVTYVHCASSGISGTSTFEFSEDFIINSGDDSSKTLNIKPLLAYLQKLIRPVSRWFSDNFDSVYKQQALHVQGAFPNPFAYIPFASFVVHVPT
jgi:hypothetical protein